MRKNLLLTITTCFLPVIAFASTGDTTFNDIYTQISGYLTGSLGLVFVILGFLGAGAAVAGFASMKVMFPVFGLALALHYGPGILVKIFGATGDINDGTIYQTGNFEISSLIVLMLAIVVFALGIVKHKYKVKDSK